MKKETIFRHELNESMAANAAMSCLKNRNKPQQMNEAVPVVAGLVRLAMPLLRPIITKLVRGMIVKAGAKLTGRQVAKMVIKNVSNGKTLMKIGKKVGQTWTELPSELKDEITKTAINTFNELRTKKSEPQIATQEQEEETSAFDERFAYRKDLRDMANDVTKKAYMIIRKEYGDSMWRRLHMDDCDERGLISQMNDYQKYYNITNPQDIADCMLGRKSVRSFKKSREEQEEVKNYRDKLSGQYEEYVLPDIVDMVSDKGISEEEVKTRLLKSPKLPWEYDEIEEWVAKNFPEEQEEVKLSESEIEELTFKLADYLMESFIVLEDEDEDYSNLLEAVEKILRKDAPKSNTVAGYYAWCRKWFMKIEDLTYSYYNEPNPESYYSDEDEENTLQAYYSQDEPDYENDHHGIWLIINLMRKKGMLRAQGIEGRDNVDDGHAIDAAYDLIEQKLNDEGMWIGDDDHEAERFVSFFGDEIAEEAMKSAIHNKKVDDMEGSRKEYYSQDEPDYDDDSHGIRLILNMLMKRGDITKNDVPRVQKQIKSMLDDNGLWIGDDDHEAERFIEMYWDNQEQEETSLDTEYFSDLEEQEAYYENFRAIAKLIADQIDKENGKGIDNNMDTLFEIVREVWNNNPDDLYIWDFDDVQEKDCYKFFDKYYETIKNEYLKREHNNIMAATHDDLFASEQEELPQMERHDMILALSEYMSESWIATDDEDGDLDDIYYAVADILDKTGDYPASTSWKDCKPWCQKHYKEVESRVITEEDEEWSVSSFEIYVDDIYETLMEIGDGEILDEVSSKRVKSIIGKILKKTNNFPHDDNELARWVRKWNKKIVEILERR